jgi:hypothetical protein
LTADLLLNLKSFESTDCQSVVDLRDYFGPIHDQPRGKGGDVPKEFGRSLQDEQFDVAIGRLGREFETSFRRHLKKNKSSFTEKFSLFVFHPKFSLFSPSNHYKIPLKSSAD